MIASLVLVLLSYGQLILGACLRHIPDGADPNVYAALLITHLTTAFAVAILGVVNAYFAERRNWREGGVRPASRALLVMILLQLGLGAATYVVKFGWPNWMAGYRFAAEFVVAEKTFWQTNLVTMHVAMGSLILATSAYQFVRVSRTIYLSECKSVSASAKLELAGA
jgi:cytochrome c oxidase assembly protein subunit 15